MRENRLLMTCMSVAPRHQLQELFTFETAGREYAACYNQTDGTVTIVGENGGFAIEIGGVAGEQFDLFGPMVNPSLMRFWCECSGDSPVGLEARGGWYCWSCGAFQAAPSEEPVSAPDPRSPIETEFWAAYRRLRPDPLTGLTPQHHITASGRNYTLDFALVEQKIAFELDGYTWHSSRVAWAKDRRRDVALSLLGWRVYRFDGSLVKRDPESVVRMAAEIVRQAAR